MSPLTAPLSLLCSVLSPCALPSYRWPYASFYGPAIQTLPSLMLRVPCLLSCPSANDPTITVRPRAPLVVLDFSSDFVSAFIPPFFFLSRRTLAPSCLDFSLFAPRLLLWLASCDSIPDPELPLSAPYRVFTLAGGVLAS